MSTALLPSSTAESICKARDAAIAKMADAAELLEMGYAAAKAAEVTAREAHGAACYLHNDRTATKLYGSLFANFDREAALKVYREAVDARIWMNLVSVTGMSALMDQEAKETLWNDLANDVPEVTLDNIYATLKALQADAGLIFARGLANCFSQLDRRFKTHNGFGIGNRIILTDVFDQRGMWNYHRHMGDVFADVERVFETLDGGRFTGESIATAVTRSRAGGWDPRQSTTETDYFRIRCFKNGNAHLWFKRDDLVAKANRVLADYFGDVLGDAVPEGASVHTTTTTALCKDLQFYETPPAAANLLLRTGGVEGLDVLEPSAGNGAIVNLLLGRGAASVHAIEVDPHRYAVLNGINDKRLRVTHANFLRVPQVAMYDMVAMNPPFSGTHWMDHVRHAFGFLRPRGTLRAILPVTAELGETKGHRDFRKWAATHTQFGGLQFTDLPPESFKASGTNVNTVILTLYRR